MIKTLWKYMMCALAIVMMFTSVAAYAQEDPAGETETSSSSGVFDTITTRMIYTFQNSRTVIFIVGGFGLIGLGFAAIFGKVNWKWLAALACGLAIVAVAGQVVDYVTRSDANQANPDKGGQYFGDTLDSSTSAYSSQYQGDGGDDE